MMNRALFVACIALVIAPTTTRSETIRNAYFRLESTPHGIAIACDPRGEGNHGPVQAWLGPWGMTNGGSMVATSANAIQVRGARYRNLDIGTGGYSGSFDGADGLAPAGTLGQSFRLAPDQGLLHGVSVFISGQGIQETAVTITLHRDNPHSLDSLLRNHGPRPLPRGRRCLEEVL